LRFLLFVSTFLTLYSALHFYAFLKARKAMSLAGCTGVLLVIFMLVMIFSPVIVRLLENFGFERSGRVMAYIGYSWMGLLFLFICASLFLDGISLIAYLARMVTDKPLSIFAFSSKFAFFAAVAATALAGVYGSYEAWQIRTEHVTIPTAKLTDSEGPIRVVQISDVHLGLIVRQARLGRILQKVKEASPDVFVSTGDLVDGQGDHLTQVVEMFREIDPRLGKFAVTGNHEFYAGIGLSLDLTKQAGFTVLRGEGMSVSGVFNVAGVDDPAGRGFDVVKEGPEKTILSGLPKDKFTLLLKHRPVVDENSLGLFDLQLSGHAHKGQIFPFTIIVRLFFPMIAGLYDLPSGSLLYVSRGSGTWGPPIRFLSPPEVTVIDIVPGKTEQGVKPNPS
jgi:predicted MPP superfamily phosphohydrolase